ncbi:hypothetical protein CEXT_695291 [Caerostris extrusa]|uniref:Uncharacterized protein n=1 Tax=Caerostris extrusa TaxID=172846 RepID=A0AAV4RR14_CAEEX|nr:hypothetical protein CEXT_695291 [Caerostris extrusa]
MTETIRYMSRPRECTVIFIKNHLPLSPHTYSSLQCIETTIISLNLPNLDPIIIAFIYVTVTSVPQLFTLDLESMQLVCKYHHVRGL